MPNQERTVEKTKKKKEVKHSLAFIMNEYGLSKSIVEKNFPEPELARNPHYACAAPMKLWTEAQIKRALKKKAVVEYLEKKKEKAGKNNGKPIRKYESSSELQERLNRENEELAELFREYDMEHMRLEAMKYDRKFILHVGPTNSGKTHDAMEALKNSDDGIYLGPLRLLALEMYDRLNADGYECELLTGEERLGNPEAPFRASTIEVCEYGKEYSCAVIDEAQMINDSARGAFWTKALYELKAAEIHVCLAPEAEKLITGIVSGFGAEYSVVKHERLAPLKYTEEFRKIRDARPGDALITFSRRDVLAKAAELEGIGLKASIIYGALPPASRREEIRRFVSGESKVIVATDAIGMGISVPIKRVVFCETKKFDGMSRRALTEQEIKQVAGRAGRYGIYDEGEVTAVGGSRLVEKALDDSISDMEFITVPFPEKVVESDYPLTKLIGFWNSMKMPFGYRKQNLEEALTLLSVLPAEIVKKADKRLILNLITCSCNTKDDRLVFYWADCAMRIISGKEPVAPDISMNTLEECEYSYHAMDIYHQMERKVNKETDLGRIRNIICGKINEFLRNSLKQYAWRCEICNRKISSFDSKNGGLCPECIKKGRRLFREEWEW